MDKGTSRSAHRIVHQADAGSRHAEARRTAGVSIEPAHAEASAGQFQSRGCRRRLVLIPYQGEMQHVPSGAEFHRRGERSQRQGTVPPRSSGSGYGSRLCRQVGNRQVPDDTTARTLPARTLFPRWERARPPRCRQSLRCAVQSRTDRTAKGISCRVPEIAVTRKHHSDERADERYVGPFPDSQKARALGAAQRRITGRSRQAPPPIV